MRQRVAGYPGHRAGKAGCRLGTHATSHAGWGLGIHARPGTGVCDAGGADLNTGVNAGAETSPAA